MINRFEMLTTGIAQIQKKIQKIKRLKMNSFGLKGAHVMCIYYLHQNPEGLTAADLSRKCVEDKAAISRILSELEKNHFIYYEESSLGKKYRAKVKLTLEGEAYARQNKQSHSENYGTIQSGNFGGRTKNLLSRSVHHFRKPGSRVPGTGIRTLVINTEYTIKGRRTNHASTSETILPHLSAGTENCASISSLQKAYNTGKCQSNPRYYGKEPL